MTQSQFLNLVTEYRNAERTYHDGATWERMQVANSIGARLDAALAAIAEQAKQRQATQQQDLFPADERKDG